jgi:DNA polymerase-3 subunit gamma/tau
VAETSLYRRHRPQSFDQVVGQEHVVRTLSNAIERDRIHHAYLFVGSRGTGKTSMAKILARSLNCVNGPTVTPCGECDSCRAIAAGTSLDVIEMDAASNRSVDDIRELRERVGYAPAAGRWKVYILDEAHMLTREAWNAFLKTLEEPPPNTVFVLATTEAHKVMPTIVDRCQRFDFGRPAPEHIAEVIARVASAEEISIDDAAVGAIARAANGSFRDGLGTLDQLVAYSGTEVATDDVLAVLGVADADLLFDAADALAAADGRAVLELLAGLARSGRDPSRFAADLVAHLRQLLVVGTLGEVPDHFFVTEEHAGRLTSQASRLGEVALLRAIDELSAAIAAIREGDDARMTVELAMLRCARPEIDPSKAALAQRLERLERALEQGAGAAPPPADAPAPGGTAGRSQGVPRSAEVSGEEEGEEPEASAGPPRGEGIDAETRQDSPAADGAGVRSETAGPVEAIAQGAIATAEQVRTRVEDVRDEVEARVEEVRSEVEARVEGVRGEVEARAEEVRDDVERGVEGAAHAASEALDVERLRGLWPAVVDQVRQSGSEFLSAAFQAARPVAVDERRATVEIGFPPDAAFNKRKAEAKENRERFAEALRTIVGRRLSPSYVLLEEEPEEQEPEQNAEQPVDEGELIERFKAEFDAEEFVEHDESGQEGTASTNGERSSEHATDPEEGES